MCRHRSTLNIHKKKNEKSTFYPNTVSKFYYLLNIGEHQTLDRIRTRKRNLQKTIVHDSNHILKLFKTLTSRGIKNTRACSVSGKFEKQGMKNLGVFHYLGAWKLSLYCLFFDFPFHPVNLCIARRRINQPVTVRRNNKSAFSKRAAEGACFFCRGRKAAAFDPRNSIEIYETRRSFNAWYPPRS